MSELSLAVNIAGAALFALVGVGILAIARTSKRGLLVGAAATTFGMTWVSENVIDTSQRAVGELGVLVFASFGAVSSIALAVHLLHGLPRRAKWGVTALGMPLVLVWILFFAITVAEDASVGILDRMRTIGYGTFLLSLVFQLAAIAMAFRSGGPAPRALAALGLAYGPFVVFLFMAFAGSAGFDPASRGTGREIVFLCLGGITVGAILPFARARASVDAFSRKVFPVLFVSGLLGLLLVTLPTRFQDVGSFGLLRTFGAFFLALAVLRFDLLGIPLPRLAARRGTLATGALAALFIVAQIAQEFFAAEYGLLIGGVIAGTVLFAANPIQRAMERLVETPQAWGPRGAVAPGTVGDAARGEASFRKAVQLAMQDRVLTREEEVHLHELARDLGLDGARAHAILLAIEREVHG